MLKKVVVQGLVGPILPTPYSSSEGLCHMPRHVLGEERSGEGLSHVTADVKCQAGGLTK